MMLVASDLLSHLSRGVFVIVLALLATGVDRDAETPAVETTPATIADVRTRIQTQARLPGAERLAALIELPVIPWVEGACLWVDNAYSSDGTRYLAMQLTLANQGQTALELKREKIRLNAGGKTYDVGKLPRNVPILTHQGEKRQSTLLPPKELTIAPGEAATFWILFPGIAIEPVTPECSLQLDYEDGSSQAIHVTSQLEARLGLVRERIGPRNALVVLTIHGALDWLSAGRLAKVIEGEASSGAARFLIDWAPESTVADGMLQTWLLSANTRGDRENSLLLQLPRLPSLRKIVLAGNAPVRDSEEIVPQADERFLERFFPEGLPVHFVEGEINIFTDASDAAFACLGELYGRLSPRELLQELRSGHPWSQLAVLRAASDRLEADTLPLILSLADSGDLRMRNAAMIALGQQASPVATQRLKEIAAGESSQEEELAIRSLIQSPYAENRNLALELVGQAKTRLPAARVLEAVAANYHPDWDAYLAESTRSSDPLAQIEALQVLGQVGHRELSTLCLDALKDSHPEVRRQAFECLMEIGDPKCEEAAVTYAIGELTNAAEPDDAVIDFVETMRDSRAGAPLLALILRDDESRQRRIEVLKAVGNADQIRTLLESMGDFAAEDQAVALQLAAQLSDADQLRFARAAAKSESDEVFGTAVGLLQGIGNDEATEILSEMLESRRDDQLFPICAALGQLGTERSIHALHAFRAKSAEQKRYRVIAIVEYGLQQWREGLPGWRYVQSAAYHLDENDLSGAERMLSMAIRLNPELALAYSSRGNTRLRRENVDQAGEDFARALELDPFDNQAVTGVALVWARKGDWKKGVAFVEEQAPRYASDANYAYNTACVYGRAIESLKTQPQTSERDASIRELEEKSIARLEASVEAGFTQFDWMKKDPDLTMLHHLDGFRKVSDRRDEDY